MKVWIDIVTPKHALFFEPFYRELHGDNQGRSRLIDAQLSLALGHSTEKQESKYKRRLGAASKEMCL